MELTPGIDELDAQQCADVLVSTVAGERAAGARRLRLIGQWAVVHGPDTLLTDPDVPALPGAERLRTYGGQGTPQVAEFSTHELAVLLGVPVGVAGNMLADVLDLTHRHPKLWAQLEHTAACDSPGHDPALATGCVQAWQATWVARRCRAAGLSLEAAQWVDDHTTDHIGTQAWTRFQGTVDARIKQADPALAEQKRLAKEAAKRVTVSATNEHGMKTLTVQLPAAQIIILRARINQLAQILQAAINATHDSVVPIGQLEADALLLMANPAEALQLLVWGATPRPTESDIGADEPVEPFADRELSRREGGDAGESVPEDEGHRLRHPFDNPRFGHHAMTRWQRDHDLTEHNPPDPETQPDPDWQPEPPDTSTVPGDPLAHACACCGDIHDPADPGERSGRHRRESSALTPLPLPDGLDPGLLRPTIRLFLHASRDDFRAGVGIVRTEPDGTALTTAEAIDLLGHTHVKITPVLDLEGQTPVDAYEIPQRLADATRLAYPTCVFPYATTSSQAEGVDADHVLRYTRGGATGQTSLDNLAPLNRPSHRVKTHGHGWTLASPARGIHLWRTPHGYCFQRDTTGTTPLGKQTAAEFQQMLCELIECETWDQLTDEELAG